MIQKLIFMRVYSPVIFLGGDNRIIYIGTTDFVKLLCHAREVSPGRGFSSGASIAEKRGLEIFWGKYLKITRFSDRYILYKSVRSLPGKRVFFGGLYCREMGLGNFLGQVS